MKKVRFALPVVAVMFAVAGVFATGNSRIDVLTVDVHASSQSGCAIDGTCNDQVSGSCTLVSGATFKRVIDPVTCTNIYSSGKFTAI